MSGRSVPRPEGLEILANLMLGPDPGAEPLPSPPQDGAHAALDRVLVEALSRPPCLVSFSGGRDSSAVLALATATARRHGLAEPVPAMMRFSGAPDSQETEWQLAVLEHLGLRERHVLELTDELDALGTAAADVLRRHGLLWPGNAYMHRPVIELARGGTLLTGIGGDELFSTSAPRRSLRAFGASLLPARTREAAWRSHNDPGGYGWLTPPGRSAVLEALAREEIECPYPWDAALRHWHASRAFGAIQGSLSLIAEPYDVRVINPLLEPRVMAAIAVDGGRRGFPGRTLAMAWLCGDLLPAKVIARSTKARFGGAVWGPAVREFAASWDGRIAAPQEGGRIEPGAVYSHAVRAELGRGEPDFRIILLLQQLWLESQAGSAASS